MLFCLATWESAMANEKRKFSLYLGTETAARETILSSAFTEKIESGQAKKLSPKEDTHADFDAYYHLSRAKTPKWMTVLSDTFHVPAFKRSSPACVVVFQEKGRTFAATFGYGSKLLNEYQIEADFGIKVAVNAVADDALKGIQKSNVASAIQQFAQSAFKSRFGSFGGQSKFEVLKRVSGAVAGEDDLDTLVGGAGLSLVTTLKFADIKKIAAKALKFYQSNAYKDTTFAVIDEFKPVLLPGEADRLNALLVENLRSAASSFELCLPQLTLDDTGYVKIYGVGLREEFPDISLELYKSTFDNPDQIELSDLNDDRVRLYNDEHDNVGNWSVYRCLIGSLEDSNGVRYVLNEGRWYIPSDSIIGPVEKYFSNKKLEPDSKLQTFEVTSWKKEIGNKGKTKLVPVYEREEIYNERIALTSGYVLFDQAWHKTEDGTITKLEVCDLYDAQNLRMIHVKRTSRQPSMVSYLFDQGQRAADLWQRDDVRAQFVDRVRSVVGDDAADKLSTAAPGDIIIEFAIADHENIKGEYTIPFLGKLSFENKAREIERRGFTCQIRFIPLKKPTVV
jgi:uncharacterized protein (TIGR04141 family)